MRKEERAKRRAVENAINNLRMNGYSFIHWRNYDYNNLVNIGYQYRAGAKDRRSYNDAIIMGDTETSKKDPSGVYENHVVAWTLSIRAYDMNICTLYGHRPDTFVECLEKVHISMRGSRTICFFHNLPYDYVFLRQFFFRRFGDPVEQLNVKPHYPLFVEFDNGITLRDSLIIAQRSLARWASDMNAEHQKAVGMWDYDRMRNQDEEFTPDELEYIEHDTLAGVECIDILRKMLKKHIYSIPFTATGIPREATRKIGKAFRAHEQFLRMLPADPLKAYNQQLKMEMCFHGGYVHGNRHHIGDIITEEDYGIITCYDFCSSYPFIMCAEPLPMEAFHEVDPMKIDDLLSLSDKYAFMFRLILVHPKLKNDFEPMPVLQFSKCVNYFNPILDNGRILAAGLVELYVTEQDLYVIAQQYDYDKEKSFCCEVEAAKKALLPWWFRSYVFGLFKEKCELKPEAGGDPVLYSLKKGEINSCFGMSVQKPVKPDIKEDYKSGEFKIADNDPIEKFTKYMESKNSILPFSWGCWITSTAMKNLFEMGSCIRDNADPERGGLWLYSDTDSCYGVGWDEKKLEAYNNKCKEKLTAAGFGPVTVNGKEYWLGIAEKDGEYSEFVTMGCKRYCCRSKKDGELHITVAGVPKKRGAKCLNDNIENFKTGFIFDGATTGKKLHTYFFNDIYTDKNGNITGDSIDLSECSYILDESKMYKLDPKKHKIVLQDSWEKVFFDDINMEFAGVTEDDEIF